MRGAEISLILLLLVMLTLIQIVWPVNQGKIDILPVIVKQLVEPTPTPFSRELYERASRGEVK